MIEVMGLSKHYGSFVALRGLVGLPAAAMVAAASALTVIATEVALGILWLGGRFERLDSSAELGP